MNDGKLNAIMEVMQGVSYHDWQKIRQVIDNSFDSQIRDCQKEMTVPRPDGAFRRYYENYMS